MKILTIKSRKHIVEDRNNADASYSTKSFILFICPTPLKNIGPNKKYRAVEFTRLGIVVTKRIHKNAVIRNKFRRRIREAFKMVDKSLLKNCYDYEIIARQGIFNININGLVSDVEKCLRGKVKENVAR